MSKPTESSNPPTLSVVSFVLALLGLLLGFHNVTQRGAAMQQLDGIARSHARANADARLMALEADRDALLEDVEALKKLVETAEKNVEDAADAP